MDYRQTCDYLFTSMPSFQQVGGEGYKPGLERVESFCEYLGSPHRSYLTIHIAGTNGKGSTSSMLAAVLQSAGYRVGLFTSPHLVDFRERIRVDGEMIGEREVVDFVEEHREVMEAMSLSFFEMSAAMAFSYFAHCEVDIAIIECGLGGRLDATNIVDPILAIITNIGIDHVQYLGDTLPRIAAEKAGIIKYGKSVILGERGEEYTSVIESIAEQRGSQLLFAEDHYRFISAQNGVITLEGDEERITLTLDLKGEYQHKNIVTLLTAVDYLNASPYPIDISQSELRTALKQVAKLTSLRGRWQTIGENPLMICDTGHNKSGIEYITRQLNKLANQRLFCVLGFANDKDIDSIIPLFAALTPQTQFIFTRAQQSRSMPIESIVEIAQRYEMDYTTSPTINEAIALAKREATADDVIFIGGSNFVVAEIDHDLNM